MYALVRMGIFILRNLLVPKDRSVADMFYKYKNNLKREKGFLLVDSLMAAAVLSIGLVATVSLVSSSVRQYSSNRDMVIAAGLAQEGVEIMRNIRDNNLAQIANDTSSTTWTKDDTFRYFPLKDDNNSCGGGRCCHIDPSSYNYSDNHSASSGNTTVGLICNGDSGFYGSNVNYRYKLVLDDNRGYIHRSENSRFYRKIEVQYPSNDTRRVISYAGWGDYPTQLSDCTLGNKCIYVQSTFTEWKD